MEATLEELRNTIKRGTRSLKAESNRTRWEIKAMEEDIKVVQLTNKHLERLVSAKEERVQDLQERLKEFAGSEGGKKQEAVEEATVSSTTQWQRQKAIEAFVESRKALQTIKNEALETIKATQRLEAQAKFEQRINDNLKAQILALQTEESAGPATNCTDWGTISEDSRSETGRSMYATDQDDVVSELSGGDDTAAPDSLAMATEDSLLYDDASSFQLAIAGSWGWEAGRD